MDKSFQVVWMISNINDKFSFLNPDCSVVLLDSYQQI